MKNEKTATRMMHLVWNEKNILIGTIFFSLLQVVSLLFGPYIIGKTIDEMLGIGIVNFPAVFKYLILFAISFILLSISQWVVARLTNMLAYKIVEKLRNEIMFKINELSIASIDITPQGSYVSLMITDVEQISNGILQGGTQLFTGLLTILGTIAFMIYTEYHIAFLVLLLTPISIVVAQVIAKGVYKRFTEQSLVRAEFAGLAEEFISNEMLIHNLGYENQASTRFESINKKLYDVGWVAHFFSATLNPSTRLVNNIIYAAVGTYGTFLIFSSALTIGALSSFLSYANQYMKPFNDISNVMTELQTALASMERIFLLIDSPSEVPDSDNAIEMHDVKGKVTIDNISFSYVPEKPFIEDFHFETDPGKTIAIVGPTGCGKTTLINLLMRFYELNGGRILIDDIDIKDMTKASLRNSFGMVLQDSWIFTGTVAENIAYGDETATKEQIVEAAKKAQIHHSIMQLPNGYETMLSSKHETLSQGQLQLICVARMMLLDPPMLILDEATSSIDTRTEILIQKAFDTIMKGKTSFVIAHRLSTIKNADEILVMNTGKLVEHGSHKELLATKGFYHDLYYSQFAKDEN